MKWMARKWQLVQALNQDAEVLATFGWEYDTEAKLFSHEKFGAARVTLDAAFKIHETMRNLDI